MDTGTNVTMEAAVGSFLWCTYITMFTKVVMDVIDMPHEIGLVS